MAGIDWNEISSKSNGGTELLCRRLENSFDSSLLNEFQIIPSRIRELDKNKYRIYWVHDLPHDFEVQKALQQDHNSGGWARFHKIVFVSYHQMNGCIERYGIPHSKCLVIQNGIFPLEKRTSFPREDDTVKIIYHTTPHRGLGILATVFDNLWKKNKKIHLDVYSSYSIYGWNDRDEQFKDLFKFLDEHEGITNHGAVSNEEVRKAVSASDIFAYPSIWPETSCLALIEAMSAGLECVHSSLGALPETSSNWTSMYPHHENPSVHAGIFHRVLESAIDSVRNKNDDHRRDAMAAYASSVYDWNSRAKAKWKSLFESVLAEKASKEIPGGVFRYER